MYAAGKKKNASYKYGQAMKDAKSSYKRKGAKASEVVEEEAPKKRRGRKKKKSVKKKDREEEDE